MGIKAKKVKLSAKGRKITRYESRWARRLLNNERRFVRWFKKHPPNVAFDTKRTLRENRKEHVMSWLAGHVDKVMSLGYLGDVNGPGVDPSTT